MLNNEKISREVTAFVGEKIRQKTAFIVENGLDLMEDAGLAVLQRLAKNERTKKMLHSKSPELFHLFAKVRRISPLLPIVVGGIAQKSIHLSLKIGFNAIGFPEKLMKSMGKMKI